MSCITTRTNKASADRNGNPFIAPSRLTVADFLEDFVSLYTKTTKGLTYQRGYARKQYDEVKLTIPNVVKTYERLIAQKRFPGEDAIAQIPQYELGRLARTVYHGFYDAPDEIPRPYLQGADFYDAVPTIEAQLPDKAKAAEILDALTTRLDGLQEGDRYYDSVHHAREQLAEYVNGTFSLFNHKHDLPVVPYCADFARGVFVKHQGLKRRPQHRSVTRLLFTVFILLAAQFRMQMTGVPLTAVYRV